MTNYKIADGSDVALASMTDISPQPRSTGVQSTRRNYSANGEVGDDGDYVELIFDVSDSATNYASLINQFGVKTATSNAVTVYCPNQYGTFTRYNGNACRPEVGRDMKHENYFYRNITILIRDLTAAA